MPVEKTGIELSRKGVLLSANYNSKEGALIRVWEQNGTSGQLAITLPEKMKTKTTIPVDLRGTITANPIKFTERKLVFYLNAYAPVSFVLN